MRPRNRAEKIREGMLRDPNISEQHKAFLLDTAKELERLDQVEDNLINLIYQPRERSVGEAMMHLLGAKPR